MNPKAKTIIQLMESAHCRDIFLDNGLFICHRFSTDWWYIDFNSKIKRIEDWNEEVLDKTLECLESGLRRRKEVMDLITNQS